MMIIKNLIETKQNWIQLWNCDGQVVYKKTDWSKKYYWEKIRDENLLKKHNYLDINQMIQKKMIHGE